MKTQEQIEAALKKYQQLLEENQAKMDFEESFLTASEFMKDKETYVQSVKRYHEAEKAVFACQKLIKNCRWILDIE